MLQPSTMMRQCRGEVCVRGTSSSRGLNDAWNLELAPRAPSPFLTCSLLPIHPEQTHTHAGLGRQAIDAAAANAQSLRHPYE